MADGRKLLIRPMPDDFPAVQQTMTQRELGKHYNAGPTTIRRWIALSGSYKGRQVRSVPDDFIELSKVMTREKMKAHYRCGTDTFARWVSETGIDKNVLRLPANIDELAAGTNLTKLAQKLDWHVASVKRILRRDRPDLYAKCAAVGMVQSAKRYKPARVAVLPEVRLPKPQPVTLADRARQFLQPYGPCYSAKFSAKPAMGGYFFKGVHYTANALIEEAKKRGFDPDGWKALAA